MTCPDCGATLIRTASLAGCAITLGDAPPKHDVKEGAFIVVAGVAIYTEHPTSEKLYLPHVGKRCNASVR